METANMIAPQVNDWLDHNIEEGSRKDGKPFFMWLNVWDPHTPYRTSRDFENPATGDPIPGWEVASSIWSAWRKPVGKRSPTGYGRNTGLNDGMTDRIRSAG